MGKKAKSKEKKAPTVELSEEVSQKVAAKKQEGDNAFGSKKYAEAIAAYQAAIKELPESHAEVATLHSNKAAVYLMEKKYKEAVRECNLALAIDGSHLKALTRRSKARQELGMYKDSLSDMQKVNATSEKTPDTEKAEAHLKDLVAGRTQATPAPSTAAQLIAAAAQQQQQQGSLKERARQQLQRQVLTCKVVCEDEIKLVHIRWGITYYELRRMMMEKWPGTKHFKISYQDKDNDWVLITCARDVQKSMQDVLAYTQKLMSGDTRADIESQMPKYKLTKCKKADVPAPPTEEVPREELKTKVIVKSTDPLAEETVVELDDWLIDFANLFREHLSIDPDKHVDVHREGWEKCTKALDSAIKLPEGRALFAESLDRFRDVTCIGLYNWGNVHVCLAKKIVEDAAANGKTPKDIRAEFDKECAAAMKRYNEALAYNPKYVDGILGIAQVQIEKAKLAAGLLIPPLEPVDQEELKDADPETLEDVNKETALDANNKLKAALKKVKKDDVLKAASHWKEVYATFAKAASVIPAEKRDSTKSREAQRADDVVSPEPTDATHELANQVQIMWGNALYDQSQLWAGLDLPGWKDMVLEAKKRFTDATCPEKDVLQALRNHMRAADLDLPPEEPPKRAEAAKPAAAAPAKPDKPAAKGLPSLEKPKKKEGK